MGSGRRGARSLALGRKESARSIGFVGAVHANLYELGYAGDPFGRRAIRSEDRNSLLEGQGNISRVVERGVVLESQFNRTVGRLSGAASRKLDSQEVRHRASHDLGRASLLQHRGAPESVPNLADNEVWGDQIVLAGSEPLQWGEVGF